MTSVYEILQKVKCLSDKRKRRSVPLFNIVMPVLLFLMLLVNANTPLTFN